MHGRDYTGQGSDRVMDMRRAQESVTLLEEFRDTTLFVKTAEYVVLGSATYNGGYHYNGKMTFALLSHCSQQ